MKREVKSKMEIEKIAGIIKITLENLNYKSEDIEQTINEFVYGTFRQYNNDDFLQVGKEALKELNITLKG